VNAGIFSPGGDGEIQITTVTGDLVQEATGTLVIDVDPVTKTSDKVEVTGSATLAGSVRVTVKDLQSAPAGQRFTLLSAEGGVTDAGLALSPALRASLLFLNKTDVVLRFDGLDFDVTGLNINQTRTSASLQEAFGLGSGGVAPVLNGLLAVTNLPDYEAALDQLGSEIFGNVETGVSDVSAYGSK
jgi:hypothetical protein